MERDSKQQTKIHPEVIDFMKVCAVAGYNINISGQTKSDKNSLLKQISIDDREDKRTTAVVPISFFQGMYFKNQPYLMHGVINVINLIRMRPDCIVMADFSQQRTILDEQRSCADKYLNYIKLLSSIMESGHQLISANIHDSNVLSDLVNATFEYNLEVKMARKLVGKSVMLESQIFYNKANTEPLLLMRTLGDSVEYKSFIPNEISIRVSSED